MAQVPHHRLLSVDEVLVEGEPVGRDLGDIGRQAEDAVGNLVDLRFHQSGSSFSRRPEPVPRPDRIQIHSTASTVSSSLPSPLTYVPPAGPSRWSVTSSPYRRVHSATMSSRMRPSCSGVSTGSRPTAR